MTRSLLQCAPERGARCCRYAGRRNKPQRRGVMVVLVLSCLLLVMALLATMVKSTLMHRSQLRTEKHARQAQLMVEAGLVRAIQELQSNPDYQGETWSLGSLAGKEARVSIAIRQSEDTVPTILVTAQFPGDGTHSVRRSTEIPYTR